MPKPILDMSISGGTPRLHDEESEGPEVDWCSERPRRWRLAGELLGAAEGPISVINRAPVLALGSGTGLTVRSGTSTGSVVIQLP